MKSTQVLIKMLQGYFYKSIRIKNQGYRIIPPHTGKRKAISKVIFLKLCIFLYKAHKLLLKDIYCLQNQ